MHVSLGRDLSCDALKRGSRRRVREAGADAKPPVVGSTVKPRRNPFPGHYPLKESFRGTVP